MAVGSASCRLGCRGRGVRSRARPLLFMASSSRLRRLVVGLSLHLQESSLDLLGLSGCRKVALVSDISRSAVVLLQALAVRALALVLLEL